MQTIGIGILGTSDIAFRRFLPALQKYEHMEYIGVGSREIAKTFQFSEHYGGIGFSGYHNVLKNDNVDAVYIPLPPALHFKWAMHALDMGKHVLLEKPTATSLDECRMLVQKAKGKNLVLFENYMFQYHNQIAYIKKLIADNIIGGLRLIRITFGFPKRSESDFRYNKSLGGGALLDCGGYTLKLATLLLGESCRIVSSRLHHGNYDTDIFGCATLENNDGLTAQVSFGMDNFYKCELELWGSRGTIVAPRIFTAPPDFEAPVRINVEKQEMHTETFQDDHFLKSIEQFYDAIENNDIREQIYEQILQQAYLVDSIQVVK